MNNKITKCELLPLVSILMPCYNHESYVISALDSVAASDYEHIEFIFIDDASVDNSFDIARKWFEVNGKRFSRAVCVKHEYNRGICATFNELYELSRGEYVSYLASDDLLLMNAISKQVSFSIKEKVDFVFSDCQLINDTGILIADSTIKYFGKNVEKLKRKLCLAAEVIYFWEVPWMKTFMKSDLFKKIGPFDEGLSYEDRYFNIRVLIFGSFSFMPETTTSYRIRLNNRLTPGLILEDVMSDFRKADCKNYNNSSGVIRLLLGVVVYSYDERYRELGISNYAFIANVFKFFGKIIRGLILLHRKTFVL